MSLLIKCINYCLLIIILFSCGGGPGPNKDDWDEDLSVDGLCSKGATCLKGTLVDTVGGTFPISNARISTIPSVDQTVISNDEGVFLIESYEFLEDVKYSITIQAKGFIADSPSNLKVRLDTLMNLYEIYLTKIPKIDTGIDSINIKEGGGRTAPKSD